MKTGIIKSKKPGHYLAQIYTGAVRIYPKYFTRKEVVQVQGSK
jgi:hypothetical protein